MPGFDRIAPFYDLLATVFSFNTIWRSQSHFIPGLKKNSSVLILGGGTGKILEELDRQDVVGSCVYVELSAKMMERTKKRWSGERRVVFIHGSVENIPNERFDIIITPYVLDCFDENELDKVMNALRDHHSPSGQWLLTDFAKDNLITRTLYFFFRITGSLKVKRLPEFEKQFTRLGYKVEREKYFFFRQLVARVYSRQ